MKIKDAIHGEIEVDQEIIIKLIETPEFQRLRKIKQLGVTNFNFPGAEHTRFIHSLGVYEISKSILETFKKQEANFFSEEEETSLKIAALLHDIGHGPLSHTFEGFFKTNHEDFTIKIIENKDGTIYKLLADYSKEKGYDYISDIVSFIKKDHKNKALVSIITSSIDADRMDYLLRDSYYTGVVYGNVDIQRIIAYMEEESGQIVFSEKSIHTLEDFILARYHMFIQIYLNKKSLIYETLIQKILDRVFYLDSQGFDFQADISLFKRLNKKPIDIKDYLCANDYNFLSILSDLIKEDDKELKRLTTYLENKNTFYVEVTKEEYDGLLEKDKFKTNSINKKVYSQSDAIKVNFKGQIKDIEEVSQIFKFCKEELTIKLSEKYYRIKELNEA